jgi:hypothetical protein
MPNEESLSELAREYLNLRREEEMERLRSRIAEIKAATARAAEEAKKEANNRAAKVAHATRNQVPLFSQGDPPRPASLRRHPSPSPEVNSLPMSPKANSPTMSQEGFTIGKHVTFFSFRFLFVYFEVQLPGPVVFLIWLHREVGEPLSIFFPKSLS